MFPSCRTWNSTGMKSRTFLQFPEMVFISFYLIGIFYQKEEGKRCLSESFLKDLGYICNFNTPAYHKLPQVFLSSNGTSVLLLPDYYGIFRFDNTLIIEQYCQQYVGYLFLKSVDFLLMHYRCHKQGNSPSNFLGVISCLINCMLLWIIDQQLKRVVIYH